MGIGWILNPNVHLTDISQLEDYDLWVDVIFTLSLNCFNVVLRIRIGLMTSSSEQVVDTLEAQVKQETPPNITLTKAITLW